MKRLPERTGILLCICMLFLLLMGCEKPDNLPQLEIQVLNESDTPVAGAYAALFESYEEWLARENPVQVWRRSGSDGKILFTDLEEKRYFFYIRFSESDNSMNTISLTEPLKINTRTEITVYIQ
jgi:hypothetical protein